MSAPSLTESPTEPAGELDARFSSPGATPLPWSDVVQRIEQAEIFWLSTVRRDGRPHVTPIPAVWLDGRLHICSGPEEQKTKNLTADPRCILTTGSDRMTDGLDVVVEGSAVRITDEARLQQLADLWQEKLDWAFEVIDGAFHEKVPEIADPDTVDHGMAHVFAIAPTKVFAFGKGEPASQTRYRFAATGEPAPARTATVRPSGSMITGRTTSVVTVSLPTEDRRRAYDFYRTALGLEADGPLADDGVPEPLQFVVNDGLRIMFVPTGGFGWVTGGRATASSEQSEVLLSLAPATEAEVDALMARAVAAGASVVMAAGPQPWGYVATFADPDGHLWMLQATSSDAA